MPELVTLTVPTTSLAKGDITTDGIVENVDRKVKWAIVQFTGGRKSRVEVDAEWTISRSQPTQAEKDAQLREYRLHALDRKEQDAARRVVDVAARLASELGQGYQLGYSRLDDLLEAQAEAQVWGRVTHVARVQAERAVSFDSETGWWSLRDAAEVAAENDKHPAFDRIEAYEYVKNLVRDQLVEYTSYASRSTSQASNLIDDYLRQAQAKFVSKHGYWF